jgi:GNAT superfamily N-acetyltransferase
MSTAGTARSPVIQPFPEPPDRGRVRLTVRLPGRVRVARLDPTDSRAVLDMLGRCSPTSLYHRFHGVTDGVGHVTNLILDSAARDSYLAWRASACVGVATLFVDEQGSGEIGVLVEDAWQGRGVGTALTLALVRRARERGLRSLQANLLAHNAFALRKLTRIGVTESSLGSGTYSVRVALGPGERP